MGVVTPIGSDLDAFWASLLTGMTGAAPVASFDTAALGVKVGCEVRDGGLPADLRPHALGGRTTELALLAARQAVEAAGLKSTLPGDPDAAVVVGTTMGDVHGFEQARGARAERDPGPEELGLLARRPLDVIGRSIASLYGMTRPAVTVPAACAAGGYAVGMAASLVARGRARAVVAVGAEAFSRLAFVGFARLGAMSPDVCRPFSRGRAGLLLGEGAAALVVESDASARARGAEIAGYVSGFGLSCDAFHVTGPHPEGLGAARALKDALKRARLDPDAVDYVNAHGTGTPLNDKVESLAIRRVFGERGARLPVSSIKALTGHMMGAAGAAEAVASLLAIRHGVVPPTWNWVERDPDCDIDCVPNEPRRADLKHVVSNSYAFGGNNASLVLSAPSARPA
jgi:3-oxoacyl-[acyl-carrier-protein] synthase II